MAHLARIKLPFPVQLAASSRLAKSVLLVLSLLVLALLAAHAQGSPFDTGFNAIQGLFTGTIAKVASLVAIVIGGYGFAHGEPGAKKGARWCCRRNRHCCYGSECLELALGRIAAFPATLTRA
ncbi:MAG: TrbC/VirB2 family protein [Candidatus Sulfotelmatobacter sp.]